MWVKVLPADKTQESYFKELSDDPKGAWTELGKLVGGAAEFMKTPKLVDVYGFDSATGLPNVVMIINAAAQHRKVPVNKKASQYYPNQYSLPIRGDAVLTGYAVYIKGAKMDHDVATMPKKWKIIYDMETALAEGGNDYEKIHGQLDDLLLEAADPDVRKMYEEARDSFKNWPTA